MLLHISQMFCTLRPFSPSPRHLAGFPSTAAVREKRSAFSRLCRHRGDPLCLEAFRRARARARRILRETQRRFWRIYLSSITFRTSLTAVFNKVCKISGKFSPPPPPVLSHAGEEADPKTVADLFAGHFSSVSRRNPTAPGARYRQGLEAVDVDFASPGGNPIMSRSFPAK